MLQMNGTYLVLENWPRREQYEFFRAYEYPFFNICTEVCVTTLHRRSKLPGGPSFFLASLHASLRAANQVEEFRLRLRPAGVWRHEVVHAGSAVLRPNDTFGFGYFDFVSEYAEFERRGRREIERLVHGTTGLEPADHRDDLIHYSVLPWIRFTGLSHARKTKPHDSVPKIVFGQHHERDGDRWLPVSVEANHALIDGLHVARFLEAFGSALKE